MGDPCLGPLGLKPRCIAAAERCTEIEEAMARFQAAGREIPDEWEIELEDMERFARGRRKDPKLQRPSVGEGVVRIDAWTSCLDCSGTGFTQNWTSGCYRGTQAGFSRCSTCEGARRLRVLPSRNSKSPGGEPEGSRDAVESAAEDLEGLRSSSRPPRTPEDPLSR